VAAGASEEQLKRLERAIGRVLGFSAQPLSGAGVIATTALLGALRVLGTGTAPGTLTLNVLSTATALGVKSIQCCSVVR
jgi:hypothetical protein